MKPKKLKALIPNISIDDRPLVEAAKKIGLEILAYTTAEPKELRSKIGQYYSDLPVFDFPSRYDQKIDAIQWRYEFEQRVRQFIKTNGIDLVLRSSRFNEADKLKLFLKLRFPFLNKFIEVKGLHWHKEKYLRLLSYHGIPCPENYLIVKDQEVPNFKKYKIEFPCICKPSACSGGVGVFIAQSLLDLETFFGPELNPENFDEVNIFYRSRNRHGLRFYLYNSGDIGSTYLVQRFIKGRILSISSGFAKGRLVSPFCYEIGPANSLFCAEQSFMWPIEREVEKKVLDLSHQLAQVLDYPNGPFMVDFILSEDGDIWVIDAAPRASSTGVQLNELVFQDTCHAEDLITSHFGYIPNRPDRKSQGQAVFWQRFPFPKGRVTKLLYPPFDERKIVLQDFRLKENDFIYELRTDRQMAQRGALATRGKDLSEAKKNWQEIFAQMEWKIDERDRP